MLFSPVLAVLLMLSRADARPATATTSMNSTNSTPRTEASTSPQATSNINETVHDPTMQTTPEQFTANLSQTFIRSLAEAASVGNDSRAEYPLWEGSKAKSKIYGDWANFTDTSAYYFVADMDVDCDGVDYQCKGNPDGLNVTDWGALSAYSVPWIVIPYSFISKPTTRHQLVGNNFAAVICNDKMYYGIFGDSNGDDPEVIGEASWLLARTCFPDENLSGASGHGKADVTYIVFNNEDAVVPDIGWTSLHNFGALRAMGDSYMRKLGNNLGLGD